MPLSPRLAAVAEFVVRGETLADIGTDHAYLPVHLMRAGAIPWAVAGDLLPGPLAAARSTVASAGLGDRIDLRQGPGLRILTPGEAACAAICGMGGTLIAEILADGPLESIRRLVLQPMGGEERLRGWLGENGWQLTAERLVEDAGRIYVVMAAEPGAMTLTEADLLIGPFVRLSGGVLLARYVGSLLGRAKSALAGARRSQRPEARGRAEALARRVQILEEVMIHARTHHW